jgi:hypothetical protein
MVDACKKVKSFKLLEDEEMEKTHENDTKVSLFFNAVKPLMLLISATAKATQ